MYAMRMQPTTENIYRAQVFHRRAAAFLTERCAESSYVHNDHLPEYLPATGRVIFVLAPFADLRQHLARKCMEK